VRAAGIGGGAAARNASELPVDRGTARFVRDESLFRARASCASARRSSVGAGCADGAAAAFAGFTALAVIAAPAIARGAVTAGGGGGSAAVAVTACFSAIRAGGVAVDPSSCGACR
jgi:hypothetical protein